MATTYAPPTPTSSGYSFVSYPADYPFSPGPHPGSPHPMAAVPAPLPHMDMSAMQHPGAHYPHPSHPHYPTYAHHLQSMGQAPPSPIVSHAHPHLPPSPATHPSHIQTPPSPDRTPTDTKLMRHLMTAMTKMQNTMKDLAERQEQILDRMSLLEQRVGRMDEGISRIIENTEIALEDSKIIRQQVEDKESQDELARVMDIVVDKLISGIGDEMGQIKKSVKETEKLVKMDPYMWADRGNMAQRLKDASMIAEQPQQPLGDL